MVPISLTMDLPNLKLGKTGNSKYRRRVTSPQMQTMLGKVGDQRFDQTVWD